VPRIELENSMYRHLTGQLHIDTLTLIREAEKIIHDWQSHIKCDQPNAPDSLAMPSFHQ
jgi:hypothetical protein